MNILITNDDGYNAKGILVLKEALDELDFTRTTIIAPKSEQSATSHKLTIHDTLKLHQVASEHYYVENGSPTDCVLLGLQTVFKDEKVDLVVSGVNHGCNIGEDITYSGTVGAAMEAILHDIGAIAISKYYNKLSSLEFEGAKKVIQDVVTGIHNHSFPLPQRRLLNINIPATTLENFQGYQVTKMGHKLYKDFATIVEQKDQKGDKCYRFGLNSIEFREENTEIMTDYEALQHNYISITPIKIDLTDKQEIPKLKEWMKKIEREK